MINASDVIRDEDFGNLTIKGIKEISIPEIEISHTPQTWGWPALVIVITILIAMKIRSRILHNRKYGAFKLAFSHLREEDSLESIYLFAKKIYSVKYLKTTDDNFLLEISNKRNLFTREEQDQVNHVLYNEVSLNDVDEIKAKLVNWIAREL